VQVNCLLDLPGQEHSDILALLRRTIRTVPHTLHHCRPDSLVY